jgi:hypothetical protein
VGLVAGATDIPALKAVRVVAPNMWILCPGVGAQGGDAQVRRGEEWGAEESRGDGRKKERNTIYSYSHKTVGPVVPVVRSEPSFMIKTTNSIVYLLVLQTVCSVGLRKSDGYGLLVSGESTHCVQSCVNSMRQGTLPSFRSRPF